MVQNPSMINDSGVLTLSQSVTTSKFHLGWVIILFVRKPLQQFFVMSRQRESVKISESGRFQSAIGVPYWNLRVISAARYRVQYSDTLPSHTYCYVPILQQVVYVV